MKIGIFTETYTPQVNGVVTYIQSFAKEAKRQGHQIYIFAPESGKEKQKPKFTEFRFKSFQFPFEKNYRVTLPVSVKNIVPLKKLKLDVVYSQNPFGIGGLLAQMFAKIKNIPIIYMNHTMYSEYLHYIFGGFESPKTSVNKLIGIFCNHCDGIITPSDKIKKYLLELQVKKPIEIIPTSFDLEEFKGKKDKWLSEKYNLSKKENIILYVGRIAKEKNIQFVVRSFKLIKEKVENVKLFIIGSGNEVDNLKKLCSSLDISGSVVFTGVLKRRDVIKAYNSADVFAFSSLTETQGLVIYEAIASGLPVVAVYDEPFKEIVIDGYNGFLVSENTEDFSKKIIYLLRNKPVLDKFSFNSQKISREKLDIKNQVEKTIKFFNFIINKHKL
ncbi:glycosyltransferase family 4 protein [Candidatus Parcubacteria bacterium]|nr:glycosyltransferase family 4 protein [Candidatus Parcubacteria bacterium]